MLKKDFVEIASIIRHHYDWESKEYEKTSEKVHEELMLLLIDLTSDLSAFFIRGNHRFDSKKFKQAAVNWDNPDK